MLDQTKKQKRLECLARQLASTGAVDWSELTGLAGLSDYDTGGHLRSLDTEPAATGFIDARVVILALPRTDVECLLPRGLQLAPQPLVMPDRHPVFFVFSTQRLDAWLGGVEFHELQLGVPWVELVEPNAMHRGPFIYTPRSYVDQPWPREVGRKVYGFERYAAVIESDDHVCTVYDSEHCELLARGEFEPTADATIPDALPYFDRVRSIFEQPMASECLRMSDEHIFYRRQRSPVMACVQHLAFDDPRTRVTPLKAKIRVTGDFPPSGVIPCRFEVGCLASHQLGAFHIRAPQTLSTPGPVSQAEYPVPSRTSHQRKKVVVLGGGPASCAAAFYLAKTGRYDITMYTLGFRLGGKCAAGRNPQAAYRIEEHGLHALIGFYNNAFRAMRDVYEHAGLPLARGEAPWTVGDLKRGRGPYAEAFNGTNAVGLMGRWRDEEGKHYWHYFPTTLPLNGRVPGETGCDEHTELQGFARAMKIILERAVGHIRVLRGTDGDCDESDEPQPVPPESDLLDRMLDHFGAQSEALIRVEEWALYRFLERAIGYFEHIAYDDLLRAIETNTTMIRAVARMLVRLRTVVRKRFASKIYIDPDRWFEWSGLDIMLTIAIGLLTDRVIHFDKLDHIDFCKWLRVHGVSPGNDQSPIVLSVYDTLFSNGGAEPVRPDDLAAGVALRWFLLLLDYRGFQAYEFRHSCPQTIFVPYYRALCRLGVEIRFFHKVEDLKIERHDGERRLVGIRLRQQATVREGPGAYDPLWLPPIAGNSKDLPPWPNRPDYRQLEEGDRLRDYNLEDAWTRWPGVGSIELREGVDFDLCVCGLSLGALRPVVGDLVDRQSAVYSEAWSRMLDGMETCQTISMQLWMQRDETELYTVPEQPHVPPHRGLLTEFAAPEPSFANFTHLLNVEGWRDAPTIDPPAFVAYHTGALTSGHPLDGHPFDEHEYPAQALAQWRRRAKNWLRHNRHTFYDRAPTQWEDFCEQLAAPRSLRGEQRLDWQYFNVGVQPWDLYVLSQPGRIKLRMGQSESRVQGLFLCGDWTKTDLNAGSVEAATQSGMLCSRVISNYPRYVWRTGY